LYQITLGLFHMTDAFRLSHSKLQITLIFAALDGRHANLPKGRLGFSAWTTSEVRVACSTSGGKRAKPKGLCPGQGSCLAAP
jgi:hypothetical protein